MPPLLLLLGAWRAAAAAAVAGSGSLEVEAIVDGGGLCKPGPLPASCREGKLADVDWPSFLALLCKSEVSRAVVAKEVARVLAKFGRETAIACMSGFIVTVMALKGVESPEWADQVVRFQPDGQVRFLINAFDDDAERTQFRQYAVTLPNRYTLLPPFPVWPFPGVLNMVRESQDFSEMKELTALEHCSEQRLEELGCTDDPTWLKLLRTICEHCRTPAGEPGLPCRYSEELLELVRSVLASHRNYRRTDCPHGLLAAILSLSGRLELSIPDTSATIFRVPRKESGGVAHVLHSAFRQVAQDPANYFSLNIPMLDLAPFPFHTGMLRSSRINSPKDAAYYQTFLGVVSASLSRAGIPHVLLPGDLSAGFWTKDELFPRGSPSSFFVPHESREQLGKLMEGLLGELRDAFSGAWRLAKPSPGGLWQLGEEPFRFSPKEGLAYRVFCSQCIYASFYFYLRDGLDSLLPLAPWTPCLVPVRRVFPARLRDLGHGVLAPFAADEPWLHRAQRPPVVWAPTGPESIGVLGESCSHARARLLQKEQVDGGVAARSLPSWPAPLTEEFDLSPGVHPEMDLFDLMRQREDSEAAGLHRYSDKVRFKTRLMKEGIPVPKIFYMSNDSPEVLQVLKDLGTSRFVAKPTHLAATSFVYVMRDGVNLVSGANTSLDEVAAGLKESWDDRHVDDWATENTPPGVIVEELVEPPMRDGQPGSTPDELKCQTFFGELFFCEWVFVRNMTTGKDGAEHFLGAHLHGDRARPSAGHGACGIPNFESKGYIFKDRSCFGCAERIPIAADEWARLVRIVEKVAAGTDHIRIDVFITPDGKPVVNEANISFLKISKLPSVLVEEMRRRWLEGYRATFT